MDRFSKEEADKLNAILSLEINPFLYHGASEGEYGSFDVHLGSTTEKWLFETRLILPLAVQEKLQWLDDDQYSAIAKVQALNEVLDEMQISSAPHWWELSFFEFRTTELWDFFVAQCRKHYHDESLGMVFDLLVNSFEELEEARRVLFVNKVNKKRFSVEKVQWAIETFDASYPLDFRDYKEPLMERELRNPLEQLQQLIGSELNDVETVFSKRWFEFKILDEMASYFHYIHDGARDSELSKQIASQTRGYMYGQLMALGRMVEHYRWKFSYEDAAVTGIEFSNANKKRGEKGGQASEKKKRQNLECFMKEIEALADLYPRISEAAIFEQAYANASIKRTMPKSQKVIDDYGTILRSDRGFRGRYQKIFAKNA